jgi:hypothetical protein
MRELCRFDHVFLATTETDSHTVLAVSDDGSVALCRTDGRGPLVCIDEWSGPEAPRVTTCYDLKRDSLPVVTQTAANASFPQIARTLTISQADFRSLSKNPLHQFFQCGS